MDITQFNTKGVGNHKIPFQEDQGQEAQCRLQGPGPALNSNFRKAMNVTHLYDRLQSEDQKDTCPISVQHSKC